MHADSRQCQLYGDTWESALSTQRPASVAVRPSAGGARPSAGVCIPLSASAAFSLRASSLCWRISSTATSSRKVPSCAPLAWSYLRSGGRAGGRGRGTSGVGGSSGDSAGS